MTEIDWDITTYARARSGLGWVFSLYHSYLSNNKLMADFMRGFSIFTFSANFLAKIKVLQMSQMIHLFKA